MMRIAIIGGGLMGHGIALTFAKAGHAVTVTDPVPDALASVRPMEPFDQQQHGLPRAGVADNSAHVFYP